VLALFGRRELRDGTIEGSAELRGTVATPMLSSAQLVLRDARVAQPLGGRPAPALRELAVQGSWEGANIAIAVTGREATGGEIRASARGRADALTELTGDAHLTRLDIAPIAAFLPGALVSAAGILDGEIAVGRGGRITGKLHVTDGALPLAAAIGTLRGATGDITTEGGSLAATLDGRLGRGTIHVAARAPLDDLAAVTADVQLREVSPIAALRPRITADVHAELHRKAEQLRAAVRISRGSIVLPKSSGTALLDVSAPADLLLAGAPTAPLGSGGADRPWLVLDVDPGEVRVDARQFSDGVGFLGTVRNDRIEVALGDGVGVSGAIVVDSADVDLLGRRYTVEPSTVVFDGTLDPVLDLHMSHAFPELTLKVDVSGHASQPKLQLSSDVSGYSNDALFAFLAGGEPTSDPNSPVRDPARAAVAGSVTRFATGMLGRQINKFLPVDVDTLSCEPDTSSTSSTAGVCTVGKQLSDRLFLAYRRRLQPRPDESADDVQIQYRLGGRALFEATGDRDHIGADLLWRQRW
jgi:hypothetical protein